MSSQMSGILSFVPLWTIFNFKHKKFRKNQFCLFIKWSQKNDMYNVTKFWNYMRNSTTVAFCNEKAQNDPNLRFNYIVARCIKIPTRYILDLVNMCTVWFHNHCFVIPNKYSKLQTSEYKWMIFYLLHSRKFWGNFFKIFGKLK